MYVYRQQTDVKLVLIIHREYYNICYTVAKLLETGLSALTAYRCLHIYVRSAVLHTWYSILFVFSQEKNQKLQGELAENQRASEANRNELVAARVQRLLAEKERDEQTEKCLLACQQRETFRDEAEEVKKQLKTLKVCVRACVHVCVRM